MKARFDQLCSTGPDISEARDQLGAAIRRLEDTYRAELATLRAKPRDRHGVGWSHHRLI